MEARSIAAQRRQEIMRDTLEQLAARWAAADKRILRPVFPLLAAGQPVPVLRIAEMAGASPSEVERALERGRAGRDGEGRVVELSGLTLGPTLHRLEIAEAVLFSCCALLAHLVPWLLGQPIKMESVDPVTRRLVKLTVAPGAISAVEPPGAMSSFVRTAPGDMTGDVGASFCRHVHHFVSADAADAFVAADDRRYAITLADLHEAAHSLYRAAWEG
jgi:hypothetical protein